MTTDQGRKRAERMLIMLMAIAGSFIVAFPTNSWAQQQPVADASSPEIIEEGVELTLAFCMHSWGLYPFVDSWGLGETAGLRVNDLELPLEQGAWECDHTWPHRPSQSLSARGETPTQRVAIDAEVHISWWNHSPDWQHYFDLMGWYCESDDLDLGFFGDDAFVLKPQQFGVANDSAVECTMHVIERPSVVSLTVAAIGDGDVCAADHEVLIVDNDSGREFAPGIVPDSPQSCDRVYRRGGLPVADSYDFASPDEGVNEQTDVFCGFTTRFPRLVNGFPIGRDTNSWSYCSVVVRPRNSSALYFSDFNGTIPHSTGYRSYEIARCESDCPQVRGPSFVTDPSDPEPTLEVIEVGAGDGGHLLRAGEVYRVSATYPYSQYYDLACREGGTDAWVGTPTPDHQSIYITAPIDGVLACESVWVGLDSGQTTASLASGNTSTSTTYGGFTSTTVQYLGGSDVESSTDATVLSTTTFPTVSGTELPITGGRSTRLAVVALALTAMGLAYLRSAVSTLARETPGPEQMK